MEVLLTATFGEVVNRCVSFFISRYSMQSREELLQRLERMLLRVGVVAEEADGRRITNQAMLRQLSTLRGEMYRGHYLLDMCRYLAGHGKGKKAKDDLQVIIPTDPRSGKNAPFSDCTAQDIIEQMVHSLETLMVDMNEFFIFLKNYPPICRQPYSMHLVLERSVFGRQVETERIINFLLEREPSGEHPLGVLPIVGQKKVGKSTLVEHACCDIRVRDHFSQILFLRGDMLKEEKLSDLRDGGKIKYQSRTLSKGKMLFVIELDEDIDESGWSRLYSASQGCIPRGSKIIITSRSEKIIKFGTTQVVQLNFLSRDASWYFFKVLLFGSTDPKEQPTLASIAMKIFEEFFDHDAFQSLIGAFAISIEVAEFLRANVNIQCWLRVLAAIRANRKRNKLYFSKSPGDMMLENKFYCYQRSAKLTQGCVVDRNIRIGLAHEEIPKIYLLEILSTTATPEGRFDAVMWKSHLPPYYNYITSCEIRNSMFVLAKNKHVKKRKHVC